MVTPIIGSPPTTRTTSITIATKIPRILLISKRGQEPKTCRLPMKVPVPRRKSPESWRVRLLSRATAERCGSAPLSRGETSELNRQEAECFRRYPLLSHYYLSSSLLFPHLSDLLRIPLPTWTSLSLQLLHIHAACRY